MLSTSAPIWVRWARSLNPLAGGPALLYVAGFGVLSGSLQIFTRYARYVSVLKWLCLSLFSYVICAFVVHVRPADLGGAIIHPPIAWNADYLMAVVAVLGTTISLVLFFWQAGQRLRTSGAAGMAHPLKGAPEEAPREFARIRMTLISAWGYPT